MTLKRLLFELLAIDAFLLFPCALSTLYGLSPEGYFVPVSGFLLIIPFLLFVLFQCFFAPQVIAVIVVVLSVIVFIRDIRNHTYLSKKALIAYIIMAIICILGLIFLPRMFSTVL